MDLGLAYNPAARNVLMVGLGAGSAVKRTRRDFPALSIHVVEIDPVVAEVARKLLPGAAGRRSPDTRRSRTAASSWRRTTTKWDVIMLDTYYSDSIPFHMVTLEFLELARSRLAQDGVIVTNVIGSLDGPRLGALPVDHAHLQGGLPVGRSSIRCSRTRATTAPGSGT